MLGWSWTGWRPFSRWSTAGGSRLRPSTVHRSQSRVSAHIAGLERELGVRLIDRTRRPATVTPAGQVLARHAREIVAGVGSARSAVGALARHGLRVAVGAHHALHRQLAVPRGHRRRWPTGTPACASMLTEQRPGRGRAQLPGRGCGGRRAADAGRTRWRPGCGSGCCGGSRSGWWSTPTTSWPGWTRRSGRRAGAVPAGRVRHRGRARGAASCWRPRVTALAPRVLVDTPQSLVAHGPGRGRRGRRQRGGAGTRRHGRPGRARRRRPGPGPGGRRLLVRRADQHRVGASLLRPCCEAPVPPGRPRRSAGRRSRAGAMRSPPPAVGSDPRSARRSRLRRRRAPRAEDAMPPFVGRQPELAVLRARLAAALAGQPQVVQHRGAGRHRQDRADRALPARTRRPAGPGRACGPAARTPSRCSPTAWSSSWPARPARRAPRCCDALPAGRAEPVHDPVTVGSRILELLGRAGRRRPVSCWWSTTCTGPICPRSRRWCSPCAGWSPTRCWPCSAVRDDADAELPESLRRLVSGHLGSVLRLRGLDEQDLRDLAAELGVDGFEMAAPRSGCATAPRATRCTPRRCWRSSRRGEWGPAEQPLPPPRSFRLLVADRYAGRSRRRPAG